MRESFDQKGTDPAVPFGIDDRLVHHYRVGIRWACRSKRAEHRERGSRQQSLNSSGKAHGAWMSDHLKKVARGRRKRSTGVGSTSKSGSATILSASVSQWFW